VKKVTYKKKWKIGALPILILLFILFFAFGSLLIPNKPTEFPPYIANSPSPTGVKAFYTLLENQYEQVQVWKRPVEQLPSNIDSQLMIMIEPDTMLNRDEQGFYKEWMEQGNNILLITEHPEGYFDIETDLTDAASQKIKTVHSDKRAFEAEIATNARLILGSKDTGLLKDRFGPVGMTRTYGEGKLIVFLAPEWVQNETILKNDHLEILLQILEQSNTNYIWVNDYIHGFQSKFAILEAYPGWFLLLFAQVALLLLLWLWSKGMRFGPIETPREFVVRFGDERIIAQANWYKRGEFYQEALGQQIEYLKLIIQEKWAIPANISNQDFAEITARRLPLDKQSWWKENWTEIHHLSMEQKVSHKQFLMWSKTIDDMRKEVQE
jgi:hypothetical protein